MLAPAAQQLADQERVAPGRLEGRFGQSRDLVDGRVTLRAAFEAWTSVPEYLPPRVPPASWTLQA